MMNGKLHGVSLILGIMPVFSHFAVADGPEPEIIQGVPDGWQLVAITDDPELDEHVAMNNVGQIVFAKRMPDGMHEEIFLYDNGKLRQITNNLLQDQGPRINDNGTITWYSQPEGPNGDADVWRWRDGVVEKLTENDVHDARPDITNTELILWSRGPTGEQVELVQYRDGVVTQVTDNGLANACVRINENEDYSWIAYDFEAEPHWLSTIMASIGGVTYELTDGTSQPQGCAITNQGLVGWHDEGGIKLWQDGVTTWLPGTDEDASGPVLNELGDIRYSSFVDPYWSPFLVRDDVTYQLTNSPDLNMGGGDLNEQREVTLAMGDFPEIDIWLMWRIRDAGDFTGDAIIDAFDFQSMMNCMSNVECGVQMPPVCLDIFDFDFDGDIDFADFGAFQRLVTPNP